jgi:acyl carrier protein
MLCSSAMMKLKKQTHIQIPSDTMLTWNTQETQENFVYAAAIP